MSNTIQIELIEQKIFLIRGHKVMLDVHLAGLYDVPTKRLNEQVKRNQNRFPADFMFQLTEEEFSGLRSHFATSKKGGRRYYPYVFTEQGIAMLSSVLQSDRAIEINIAIMRTFVKLRQVLAAHKELAQRLDELEGRMNRKDREIVSLFEAIRKLMAPANDPAKEKIGFHS